MDWLSFGPVAAKENWENSTERAKNRNIISKLWRQISQSLKKLKMKREWLLEWYDNPKHTSESKLYHFKRVQPKVLPWPYHSRCFGLTFTCHCSALPLPSKVWIIAVFKHIYLQQEQKKNKFPCLNQSVVFLFFLFLPIWNHTMQSLMWHLLLLLNAVK